VQSKIYRLPTYLKIIIGSFLFIWCLIAIFPLLWVVLMSIKLPIDSFSSNPLEVILGPETIKQRGGLSLINIFSVIVLIYFYIRIYRFKLNIFLSIKNILSSSLLSFIIALVTYTLFFLTGYILIVYLLGEFINNLFLQTIFFDFLSKPIIGFTSKHYEAVWFINEFYKQFFNTIIVTLGVITISLSVGTLAGYALARSNSMIAFWLLIAALIFRALPHSVLVTGYLEPFIEYGFYGKKSAVIILLVAINQPFTIWMLRSFFMNIPQDLDDAAQIDGCNPFQAFWLVIMPLMWPGVITTGLFSFLLAYNDYLVAALLLDGQSQTMIPAIIQYFNMETTMTDLVEAIAAAASITAPLFLLVLFFQKQIISGLTTGAVKG
jgi:multiple sugar transport system permease protein